MLCHVRTPLSFKSKRRIELLIYNPFQTMIPQSPQFHKSLRLAVPMWWYSSCIFHFTKNWKSDMRCCCAIS